MSQSGRIFFVPCAACGSRNRILDYDAAKPYPCSTCGVALAPVAAPPAVELPASVELGSTASGVPFWSAAGVAPPPRSPAAAPGGDTIRLAPFGKYALVREIGRGGMGFVYEAIDTQLERRVALKMLFTSANADPKEAALDEERFLREAKLSANLPKHPNLVSVYETGIIDGRRYLAMEYIDGQPMSAWRRFGSVTLRQQVALLRDVAHAVHHAHEHGIIHRDLKPQNILVDAKNRPNVTDFGLAKPVGTRGALSLTASGMVVGTPSYMCPEQAQGLATIDRRADVYAMGVILYEILAGRLPFTGQSPVDILMKVLRDPLIPPSAAARAREPGGAPTAAPECVPSAAVHAVIDPGIEAVCLKAMAREPGRRYPTAQAFAEDLTAWLKGEPVQAPLPEPPKAGRRRKAAACALLAVVAALGVHRAVRPPESPKPTPVPASPAGDSVTGPVPAPSSIPAADAGWALFAELKRALAPDGFDESQAKALLDRARQEYPGRAGEIGALVDEEAREIARYLEGLSRDRWLVEQPRIRRLRAWLAFFGRPVDVADRLLAWRGTCTVTLHVRPYAEVRGPLAGGLPPEDRYTPLRLRDVAIAGGRIEIAHPDHGARTLSLDGLEDGKAYAVDGDWADPDGLVLRGDP